ncbi:hypothetical protein MOC70_17145 [Bacillus vallismortis]|nr:hypothetical protein [Bacillus vallismortis]
MLRKNKGCRDFLDSLSRHGDHVCFFIEKIIKPMRYIQLKQSFLPAGIDFSTYNIPGKPLFLHLITSPYFSTIRMERRGNQIGFNRNDKQNLN